MKKSLIALAVMAAAGAASAQSSVQLYGIADVWVGSMKVETPTSSLTQTQVESGGLETSRIGIKGSEDLGGGLKANFALERGFKLDDGTATSGFDRLAFVGLSGGFGAVELGKTFTAYDDIASSTYSSFAGQTVSAPKAVFATWAAYQWTPGSTVKYITPEFGGFSGSLSYTLGEDKTTTLSASSITSVHAKYASGPVYVGVAYQTEEPQGSGDSTDFTLLNGSYDFGPAKLLLDYATMEQGSFEAADYHIGVDVPLASNLILSGGYASSQEKIAGVDGNETKGFGLALAYMLSKRTTVYAALLNKKEETAAGADVEKVQAYAVGIKHTF